MKTLGITSSKAEEMEALSKFAASCKSGSYMNSFLTPALVEWVGGRVRDDICPDILGQLWFEQKQMRMAAELDGAVRLRLEHDLRVMTHYSQRQEQLALDHNNARADYKQLFERERTEKVDAREATEVAMDEVRSLEEKVRRLQSRLYELEHPEA